MMHLKTEPWIIFRLIGDVTTKKPDSSLKESLRSSGRHYTVARCVNRSDDDDDYDDDDDDDDGSRDDRNCYNVKPPWLRAYYHSRTLLLVPYPSLVIRCFPLQHVSTYETPSWCSFSSSHDYSGQLSRG